MFYAQTFMKERSAYFCTMKEAVEWCEKVVEEDDYDIDLMEIYKVDDDSGIMIKDNIWNKPLGIIKGD